MLHGLLDTLTHDRYLWPTYTEDASNHHVLLIAVIVGIKQGEHLPIWGKIFKGTISVDIY